MAYTGSSLCCCGSLGLVCGGGVAVARVNSSQSGLSNPVLSVCVYVCRSLPVFVLLGKLWDKHFQ